MRLNRVLILCLASCAAAATNVVGAPINDDCANAIPVLENVTIIGTNADASDSGATACEGSDLNDVWYLYQPSVTQRVNISLCGSSFDTTLSVSDGCGGSVLACNDQSANCSAINNSYLECFPVEAGQDYFLRVAGYNNEFGDIELLIEPAPCLPPVNEDCASAIEVVKDVPLSGSTLFATPSGFSGCEFDAHYDVWYRYTPTVNETVTIDLCGSGFDTTLAIFDGCSGAPLVCNDQHETCVNPNASIVECLDVEAGKDYLIRIAGYGDERGNYDLLVTGCVPINDECAGAITVVEGQPVSGTTELATDSGVIGCVADNGGDVWYSYTASQTGTATFSVCDGLFDSTLTIFDGCNGAMLACNDDTVACSTYGSRIGCFPVNQGATYLLRVAGWDGEKGPFELLVEPDACTVPTNDNCEDAIPLAENVLVTGDTFGATTGLSSGCSLADAYDVWYEYTPAVDTTVDIVTCGSDFDTTLALYDACGGTELACSDDSACGRQSRIEDITLTGGVAYKIRVAGYAGDRGNYQLIITEGAAPGVTQVNPATTGPTNADAINFTVRFDQNVIGFNDAADISVIENGVTHSSVNISGSNSNYTVNIGGLVGDGTVRLRVNTASDITNASLLPLAFTLTSATVTIDNTSPEVVLSSTVADPARGPIDAQIALSEGSATLDVSDLVLDNAIAGAFSGSGQSYTFTLTPQSPGNFGASVAASAFTDLAGNGNLASNALMRVYEPQPLEVTLSPAAGPAVNSAVFVHVTLSQRSTNFALEDIVVSNAFVWELIGDGSGTGYSFYLEPDAEGLFTAQVPAAALTDTLGNGNSASNLVELSYDITEPVFSDISASPSVAAEGEEVIITFTSSEDITDTPDVQVNGNPAAPSGKALFEYAYIVQPTDTEGPAEITIGGFDLAGNLGTASDDAALTIAAGAPGMPVSGAPLLLILLGLGVGIMRRRRSRA
jgi:hypothetical protein